MMVAKALLLWWSLWTFLPLFISLVFPMKGILDQSYFFQIFLYGQAIFFSLIYPTIALSKGKKGLQEIAILYLLGIPIWVATSAFSSVTMTVTQIAQGFLILLIPSLAHLSALRVFSKKDMHLWLALSLALQMGGPSLYYLYWLFFGRPIPLLYTLSPLGALYGLFYQTTHLWLYFGVWLGMTLVWLGYGHPLK